VVAELHIQQIHDRRSTTLKNSASNNITKTIWHRIVLLKDLNLPECLIMKLWVGYPVCLVGTINHINKTISPSGDSVSVVGEMKVGGVSKGITTGRSSSIPHTKIHHGILLSHSKIICKGHGIILAGSHNRSSNSQHNKQCPLKQSLAFKGEYHGI
jgi:hypothetical protein